MDIRYKILEDREKRIGIIENRITETKNFYITIKANISGTDKNIKETNLILPLFLSKVLQVITPVSYEKIESYDGNFYLVEILEKDYVSVKKKLVDIEDSKLGRFIDLDLYTGQIRSVTRGDIDIPGRKCIICGDDYGVCVRNNSHSFQEIFNQTVTLIRTGFLEEIVSLSLRSLLEEVTAHPKFGLVTCVNSGKHTDMDYNLFKKSIESLEKHLYYFAEEGFSLNDKSFSKLRKLGLEAEEDMLVATGGVNTHKGAIFLLGVTLPSIVDAVYNNKEFFDIGNNIKLLSKNILKDFDNTLLKNNLTYGEKIYLDYGITGVRGIAKNGLDIAFSICEKFYKSVDGGNNYDINAMVINILLHSMQTVDDTVILHKKNIETLYMVKDSAKNIILAGGFDTVEGKKLVYEYTENFIKLGISPGGSADIVTIVLILMKIKEKFYFMQR